MKKLFSLFLLFFLCTTTTFAGFEISGNPVTMPSPPLDMDNVYIFNGLVNASITYRDTENRTFNWKSYTTDPAVTQDILSESGVGSTTLYNLTDATGYILEIVGVRTYYIYVFDYNLHPSTVNLLDVADQNCDETIFDMKVDIQSMEYYTSTGTKYTVIRNTALLEYNTIDENNITWDDAIQKFKETTETRTINNANTTFILTDVYANPTTFALYGDYYAEKFKKDSVQRHVEPVKPFIQAWAVADKLALNEIEDDDKYEGKDIKSSAPLNVSFTVHTNLPRMYYKWQIYNTNEPTVLVGQSTEESFQYTFSKEVEDGKYIARLDVVTVEGRCLASDSVMISLSSVKLEVPNVFTPNDDGMNDNFCVAFKSITKFEMWVYNRWGRLVFHTTNPEVCWDGYIGNAKAATGPYFYVIKATGADGSKQNQDGDINLLR